MFNNIFGGRAETSSSRRKKRLLSGISDGNTSNDYSREIQGRIAIYDDSKSKPVIQELSGDGLVGFVEKYSASIHQTSREAGGNISFSVVRELVENFIHAGFKDVLVTIDQSGNRLRFSDHGPGIADPKKALERGFTTAGSEKVAYIKGVGSGLPVCKEILESIGGGINIESNLGVGSVVTIWAPSAAETVVVPDNLSDIPQLDLGARQKRVLFLVTELGSAGPSQVAKELSISLSSAYRDLRVLEVGDLLKINEDGKRSLTALGVKYLNLLTKPE